MHILILIFKGNGLFYMFFKKNKMCILGIIGGINHESMTSCVQRQFILQLTMKNIDLNYPL